MTALHFAGGALVLLLILFVGYWSGRKVQSADDFAGKSRKAGTGVVAGAIIGTLVGGSSTIGTAQLAFNYGFSAWWFTLGGGIGLLIMGLIYVKPLYKGDALTLPSILSENYGAQSAMAATFLTSIGSFLSIVAQLLSSVGLITAVSAIPPFYAALLTAALMMVYVIFGGVMGAGKVGMVKTILMYVGIGLCGVLAITLQGGFSAFYQALPQAQYFNLFARGVVIDLGAGLSLIVGIITTQTYIQAVISAKSLKISLRGTFLSACLVPLIGIAGIYVGLFMKIVHPDIESAKALPLFIMEYLHPFPAGMVLATLLVALVGTGAGLALGISSMLTRDVYVARIRPEADDKQQLLVTRCVIAVVLAASCLFTAGNMGTLIMSWSFLSMGLRGAVAFFPLTAALFAPKSFSSKFVFASMIVGSAATILSKFLIAGIDPLFPGMLAAGITMAAGRFGRKEGSAALKEPEE